MNNVDIIIPLGNGSKSNNDELKILLRSLEKNGRNYRNVIVVSDNPPSWLKNVKIISVSDDLKHNKDGNIINKVLSALFECHDMTPEFVWTADDCAVLKEVDFSILPPIINGRTKKDFPVDGSIWQKRVHRTFEFFEKHGVYLKHNYESHTPQRFPTRKLLRAMRGIDYKSDIGYTIDTLFFGLLDVSGGFDQSLFKTTAESEKLPQLNKHFIGYNDKAFLNGLREKLLKIFPHKSKYER